MGFRFRHIAVSRDFKKQTVNRKANRRALLFARVRVERQVREQVSATQAFLLN